MNKVNTNQLSKIQSRINENNKSPEHFCDTYITTLQELKRKSNKTENSNLTWLLSYTM
jgi:hypothetical protein